MEQANSQIIRRTNVKKKEERKEGEKHGFGAYNRKVRLGF